jgi:hypothetical protein
METVKIKNLMCSVVATGAVLAYAHIGSCNPIEPDIYHLPESNYGINADTYNSYYQMISDENIIAEQVATINKFVSILLENAEELEPEFAKTVDKHFWDLA